VIKPENGKKGEKEFSPPDHRPRPKTRDLSPQKKAFDFVGKKASVTSSMSSFSRGKSPPTTVEKNAWNGRRGSFFSQRGKKRDKLAAGREKRACRCCHRPRDIALLKKKKKKKAAVYFETAQGNAAFATLGCRLHAIPRLLHEWEERAALPINGLPDPK